MSGLPLDNQNLPALGTAVVHPEQNTNYEVGLKTGPFDRRLIFNIDAFYTRVTDFQSNVTDTRAAAALRTYPANIPRVTVKGFEADANAFITRDFSLRASVAYADGKYASYPSGPCPIEAIGNPTAACNLTGVGLPGLPKWSVALGGDYAVPVAPLDGSLFLHADSISKTRQFGDPTGSRYTVIDGYTTVNASIGFRSHGMELAVFARNLFDKDFIQNVTIQAGNSGPILATPSDPRTIGVTLRARQ